MRKTPPDHRHSLPECAAVPASPAAESRPQCMPSCKTQTWTDRFHRPYKTVLWHFPDQHPHDKCRPHSGTVRPVCHSGVSASERSLRRNLQKHCSSQKKASIPFFLPPHKKQHTLRACRFPVHQNSASFSIWLKATPHKACV